MQLIVYYAAASATYLVELPDQEKATVQDVLTLLLSQQFQHGVPLPAADCDAGSSSAHSLSLRFGSLCVVVWSLFWSWLPQECPPLWGHTPGVTLTRWWCCVAYL